MPTKSDYTIGIDTVEKMVSKMKEFDGWPIYKIKLGTQDDLAIVRELLFYKARKPSFVLTPIPRGRRTRPFPSRPS